jgi:hypothetical protein
MGATLGEPISARAFGRRIGGPIAASNAPTITAAVVVVARERHGNAVPWVVNRESDAVSLIRARVASGSTVHADESGAWNKKRTVDRLLAS